jgi:hypothetical protein
MPNIEVWTKLDMAITDLFDEGEIEKKMLNHVYIANELYATLGKFVTIKEDPGEKHERQS